MRNGRARKVTLAVTALSAALFAGACGSYGDSQSAGSGGNEQAKAPQQAATVNVAKSDNLGNIVTDSEGRTLYRFDKDTTKPSKSNCEGKCAETWPPVLVNGKPSVQGVKESLVGTVKRPDGSEQLTLNDWPMYRFNKDTKPGDTKGQGVQGTWFVSTPEGKKAQASAPANAGDSSGGNGY